jgi:L-aspartate oxidase
VVAELIIRSAMLRKESRGLHYTLDYPDMLEEARVTILEPETNNRNVKKVTLINN